MLCSVFEGGLVFGFGMVVGVLENVVEGIVVVIVILGLSGVLKCVVLSGEVLWVSVEVMVVWIGSGWWLFVFLVGYVVGL